MPGLPAQTNALRWALQAMLQDGTYPERWKHRTRIETCLTEAAWPTTYYEGFAPLAIRWATTQSPATGVALRKALGQTLTDDETAVLATPARLTSIAHSMQHFLEGATMSIADVGVDEKDGWMASAFERELAIVAKEHERPPYHHPEKGADNPLVRAVALIQEERVQPRSDGSYLVRGEDGTYTCAGECSCPASQKGRSKWCYHLVAATILKEVQARLPVSAPSLPFGPTPAEARLDQHLPETAQDVAWATHAPQDDNDDRMHTSNEEATMVATATVHDGSHEARPAAPQRVEEAHGLEATIAAWGQERAALKQFLVHYLEEGTDFGKIHIMAYDKCKDGAYCKNERHFSKPVLFKSGSEKLLRGFLGYRATFHKDDEMWEMLGRPTGTLCFICTLVDAHGAVVGEGRGARDIVKDRGDVNKAIKMGQTSAQKDAVIRAAAISDLFTQDLDTEDHSEDKEGGEKPTPTIAAPRPGRADSHPTSERSTRPDLSQDERVQRREIFSTLGRLGFAGGTPEQYAAEVLERTKLTLVPENFGAILAALKAS